MKAKYYAVLASFVMVAMAFAVAATAEDQAPVTPEMSPLEELKATQEYIAEMEAMGASRYDSVSDEDFFEYTDGPYPIYKDDGSPPAPQQPPWGIHYVSDVNYAPPHNAGGWYMVEAMGGSGEFSGGNSHETYVIGDQNGNGVLEWLAGFSYKTWGEDGIDNDGDGCVDEKTFGVWDGQTGCDLIPDQVVYYETGGLVDSGGDTGDLITNVDWYSPIVATEIYRAFVTPKWMAYQLRGRTQYPDVAGEFISYYAYEGQNGVNANPEMDSDMSDYYVGVIDARGFPARPPVDRACAAGRQAYMGHTFLREDGTAIIAFYLYEYYDGHDWNGDGDNSDYVSAYFALDPTTGNCRQNAVNLGVYGYFLTTSGDLITPMYTRESNDRRDWNGDGDTSDYVKLYHTVETTIAMKGNVYTSYTFTASVPTWGFGWWAMYDTTTYRTYPLKFGVGFQVRVPTAQATFHTNIVLIDDEDGDRHTMLPRYDVSLGYPGQALGGECLFINNREPYLRNANIWLMPGPYAGDANGDGWIFQFAILLFCPDKTGGGGNFIVEETSKFAKGLYITPIPFVMTISYSYYYDAAGTASGLVMIPGNQMETYLTDDLDGNLIMSSGNLGAGPTYYWIQLTKPEFEIIPGSLDWVFTGDVQPGGTVIGTFDLINTGGTNIKIAEDKGIENDKGFKLQGLSAKDRIGPDGVIEPQEVATFYFAMTVSAGSPIGPMDVKIIVGYGGVTKEQTVTLPIILKMFGNEQSCYRHRQNALRKLRSFDFDDDEGMLHNLEPGDLVKVDDQLMAPEEAILLMVSWYENGCRNTGHEDVEHAKSAASGLTGHYGMGQSYWGLSPGQEEGNEGNGNGGLSGQDRKDVYGF
ncbi:MAG: hypothetical protein KAW09_06775 [Thermoplasmata archaeon]|nr:hypothetical protein [Thermoplasmata archaeon]